MRKSTKVKIKKAPKCPEYSMQKYMGYTIMVLENGEKTRYNNKLCYLQGMQFDSIKECKRYIQLLLLEKSHYISKLRRQTPFVLQDEFVFRGKKENAIIYYADFDYYDSKGNYIVEDVKGSKNTRTQEYLMKSKMFRYRYNFAITEVYEV